MRLAGITYAFDLATLALGTTLALNKLPQLAVAWGANHVLCSSQRGAMAI